MGKKRSFHSFRVKVALLRYIVFSFESGCDTSEPQVSYISRACSSLVRQPYHIPNRFLLKISGLETILATKKGRWDGRSFYMDEYTFDFSFLVVHKVCTKARLLGERSVRIREVKGSNPSRSTILCKSELNLLREALFRVCFYFRGCGSVRILFFRCIRYSLARLYLSDVFFLTGSIDICCADGYNQNCSICVLQRSDAVAAHIELRTALQKVPCIAV